MHIYSGVLLLRERCLYEVTRICSKTLELYACMTLSIFLSIFRYSKLILTKCNTKRSPKTWRAIIQTIIYCDQRTKHSMSGLIFSCKYDVCPERANEIKKWSIKLWLKLIDSCHVTIAMEASIIRWWSSNFVKYLQRKYLASM